MKIVLYADKSALWRWRMVASNGRIVADSGEGYSSRANARRAANNLLDFGFKFGAPGIVRPIVVK